MNDKTAAMAELCCSRNGTMRACRACRDETLDIFLSRQAEKVRRNQSVPHLKRAEDFFESAGSAVRERLGEEAAREVEKALRCGALGTADHHGALFCSQSFQGDILFSELLKKLGSPTNYVPLLSFGQVELENATYARGISTYMSGEEKQLFPIFPGKHSVQMASCSSKIDHDMMSRFVKAAEKKTDDPCLLSILKCLSSEIYESDDVQRFDRFADQVTRIGAMLSGRLFEGGDGPVFVYLEAEELIRPLLIRELKDPFSLISRLLDDEGTRRKLASSRTADGHCLGEQLFKGADEKGRKIPLALTAEGTLTGSDWHHETVTFSLDRDSLTSLLEERKLFPGVFLAALLLFFERGLTWLGGPFQSGYLPIWQQGFVQLLMDLNWKEEADRIAAYDCTGYISGPMFALFKGPDFAATAGPVEFIAARPSYERIRALLKETTLWDAHVIGLSEMYFDLVLRNEREEDWYRILAEDLYQWDQKYMLEI